MSNVGSNATDTHEPSEVERDCAWLDGITDFWNRDNRTRVLRVIRAARAYEAEKQRADRAALSNDVLLATCGEAIKERDALRARCEEVEKLWCDGVRSDCPNCGRGVKIDEDGCCATCGEDAVHRFWDGDLAEIERLRGELAEAVGLLRRMRDSLWAVDRQEVTSLLARHDSKHGGGDGE